jgi:hypothetical protein
MAFETALNKALEDGSTQFGFWLTYVTHPSYPVYADQHGSIPSAALAKTILRSNATSSAKKFSWVLIDAEHGFITDKDYYEVRFYRKMHAMTADISFLPRVSFRIIVNSIIAQQCRWI